MAAGWGRKKSSARDVSLFFFPPSFPPSQAPYDVASAFVYLLERKPGVEERSTRESRVPNRILFFLPFANLMLFSSLESSKFPAGIDLK